MSCEGSCTSIADCGDMDNNGVRDNPCLWYQCASGTCQSVARTTQADLGGATGACPIDGVGDGGEVVVHGRVPPRVLGENGTALLGSAIYRLRSANLAAASSVVHRAWARNRKLTSAA